jgi:hypothetical protein
MSNSVYDSIGKRAVISAKLFIPVRILILGAEDGRRLLPPPVQELEDCIPLEKKPIPMQRLLLIRRQPKS